MRLRLADILEIDRKHRAGGFALALAAGLLFGIFALASSQLDLGNDHISLIWLPNALALAVLLRVQLRSEGTVLGGMMLGAAAAALVNGAGPVAAVGLAACHLVEIALALTAIRRFCSLRPDMTRIDHLGRFVAIAAIAVPAVSATLAMLVGGIGSAPSPAFWVEWAASHAIGMMLLAPAALIVADALGAPRWPSWQKAGEWVLLSVSGTLLIAAIFAQRSAPLLFLIAPIMLVYAFRLGSLGASFATLKVAAIATLFTWAGSGPIVLMLGSPETKLIVLQTFLATTFVAGLPVSAILADQRRLVAEQRARSAQFRLLANNITDAVLRYDTNGVCTYASPSVGDVLGVPSSTYTGQRLRDGAHADDRDAVALTEKRLLGGMCEQERFTYRRAADDSHGEPVYIEADAAIVQDQDSGEPDGIVVSARNITQRVLLDRELVSARRHAENAAMAKAQFLANMSHEIRTPMNGVLGFTELLLQSDLPGEQRRHAELISESGKSMMRLLNDILDISKIESGHIVVQNEAVNLRHLIETCIKLHSANAAQKSLQLTFDYDADIPAGIASDGLRLRQIMLNLIGNAIKFTDAGSVALAASLADEEIVVSVRDTGIGIASDRLDSVFDPFEQADNATSRRFGGTGLGLTISRQLAELLGGTLMLESEAGRGSCFTLRIPLNVVAGDLASTQTAANGNEPPEMPPPPARILLAEDHDINRILVTAMLERCGQQVATAGDGEEAIAAVLAAREKGTPFDLVLMDIQMPRCDGYAATRKLRAAGIDLRELPIVALTANAYDDDIRAAHEAGMQGHLAKPLVFEELVKALCRWLPRGGAEAAASLPAGGSAEVLTMPRQAPPQPAPELRKKWLERRAEALNAVGNAVRRGALGGFDVDELARLVHKVAGTAGMFGEDELGTRAAAFERALRTDQTDDVRLKLAEELLQAA